MRALRLDLEFDRLTGEGLEVLIGTDATGASFRYEGDIPGGTSRQLKVEKASTLVFVNGSAFRIDVVVRDAAAAIIQTDTVNVASEVVLPLRPLAATVEFVNPDPSLARITAIIF